MKLEPIQHGTFSCPVCGGRTDNLVRAAREEEELYQRFLAALEGMTPVEYNGGWVHVARLNHTWLTRDVAEWCMHGQWVSAPIREGGQE